MKAYLGDAIEDNIVSLPGCRIKPGGILEMVVAAPGSGLRPVMASWGWRRGFVIGLVPSLEQIGEWSDAERILSEIIQYGEAASREIPMRIGPNDPDRSDLKLTPPFNNMGRLAR